MGDFKIDMLAYKQKMDKYKKIILKGLGLLIENFCKKMEAEVSSIEQQSI